MNYDIVKEERAATDAVVISRRIAASAVADALGEILPKVFEYATSSGLSISGPPFARYTDWTAGGFTLTAGLPLAEQGEGTDQIRSLTIPAGSYAKTIHAGAYDTLNEAHEALEQWIADQGLEAGSASYEFYLTDPGQYPNEADWRTEVLREISA